VDLDQQENNMISSIYSKTIPIFEAGSRKGKKKKDIEKSVDRQLSHNPNGKKKNKKLKSKKVKEDTYGLPRKNSKLEKWLERESARLKKIEDKRNNKI
jgi:hypothetical protein